MIIWGAKTKIVDGGEGGIQQCEVCNARQPFRYGLSYRMRHLYFLVRWSTGKKWFRICKVCGTNYASGPPVKASAGVDDGKKLASPIPLFDRWGWAMSIGAAALFITYAVQMGNADRAADSFLVRAPKVGDRYTVKMEKFMGTSDSDSPVNVNYGVVRIASVDAKGVTFDLPKSLWSRSSKLVSEINDEAKQDSYYMGQTVKTVAELVALDEKRVIANVER